MKAYKIRYVRNKRTIITRVVHRPKRILDAIEANKNGFRLIISADYKLSGE